VAIRPNSTTHGKQTKAISCRAITDNCIVKRKRKRFSRFARSENIWDHYHGSENGCEVHSRPAAAHFPFSVIFCSSYRAVDV